MDWWQYIVPHEWSKMFAFDTPVLEIFIRITIVYLFLVLLLRITLKRQTGGMSMRDLLVLVLIADAVQNGMAGQYTSVSDALVIGGTLIFWAFVLDWASFHWPFIDRLVQPPSIELIHHGTVLQEHLRQELVTRDDLLAQLRQQGLEDPAEVRVAIMESDGRVSILTWDDQRHRQPAEPPLA
ncbi:MAG: DUF421 domain-containing protein [Thermomicrobiales bacterium]